MSIIITGLEMPTERGSFNLTIKYNGTVLDTDTGMQVAEAHELPAHGRLVDADALHKLFEDQWHYLQVLDWNENPTAEAKQSGVNWCINTMHDSAPTIIEAEGG